jgi:putative MATE family efflux protein
MSDKEITTTVQTVPVRKAQSGIKGITTTLDSLDYGTPEDVELEFKKDRRQRRNLPENISSKALYSDIMKIAWPSLAELLLSSLVNMVDMMMVGGLGAGAISAVGLVLQPRFLLMTMIMSLNTGATAVIARARGAQDQERANSVLRQSLVLATVISIICAFFGTVFAEWMVTFMAANGMEKQTIELGVTYFKIQSITFMIPSWSFCISAALRGTGNSKPCMVYNIVANLVNILFNWLLINGNLGFPKLGVAGASIATVIGQTVGTIMAFFSVSSGKYYLKLKISLKTIFKFEKDDVSGMATVGIPAMIEHLLCGRARDLQPYSRYTWRDNMATYQICLNVQSLTMMNGQSFAVSATSLIGQSLGKLRLDMAEQYGRRCRQLAFMFPCSLRCVYHFPEQLVMLYNRDPLIVSTGGVVMLFVAFLQPIHSSQFVLGGILRGAGDTKITALYVLITTVIIRTSLGYLFVTVLITASSEPGSPLQPTRYCARYCLYSGKSG